MESPEQTLTRLVAAHQRPLLRLCCVVLRDAALAEDAVQETFLKAYRSLSGFRQEASEKTWLTAIALNVCRDMRKSAWWRHATQSLPLDTLPLPAPERDGDAFALGQAIARLPGKYRDAVLLYYYQDMTLTEAAKVLNTSPATLSKRLARARDMLHREVTQA
ncbi:MAG: sigma-70 family RNA polymerase sigma factor [Clostridia bacterium]|nr:sigma-70 family RNA polymerase sigma factor [Clostridia bacterium]